MYVFFMVISHNEVGKTVVYCFTKIYIINQRRRRGREGHKKKFNILFEFSPKVYFENLILSTQKFQNRIEYPGHYKSIKFLQTYFRENLFSPKRSLLEYFVVNSEWR
jgi:hypothetical protein